MFVFAVSAGAMEMSVPSLFVEPGSSITISISVDEAEGIASGNITLNYDGAILTAKELRKTKLMESLLVVSNIESTGAVQIGMMGIAGTDEGSGAIFEIDFDVKPDAPAGAKSDLTLAVSMSDELGNGIPVTTVNGSVSIPKEEQKVLSIVVASAEVDIGESVSGSINIDDISGVAKADIQLTYDAALLIVDDVQPTALLADIATTVNTDAPGEITISVESEKAIESGSGAIFDIQFTVKPDAETTTTAIQFASVGLSDESDQEIPVGTSDGSITIIFEYPRWDVNEDGVVDVSDLVLVGQHFGEDYSSIKAIAALSDVGSFSGKTANVRINAQNKVGIQSQRLLRVDIITEPIRNLYGLQFDLDFDSSALEVVGVKPGGVLTKDGAETYWSISKIDNQVGKILGATYVRKATENGVNASGTLATIIFEVKSINISGSTRLNLSNVKLADANARLVKAIIKSTSLNWEELLLPEKSQLLPNYPNPFNPETWLPYQLAKEANATIRIFNIQGQLIRTLNIGHREAGLYLSKERAAYWNGQNDVGEQVASGVFFYTIQADDFVAIRKMILMK